MLGKYLRYVSRVVVAQPVNMFTGGTGVFCRFSPLITRSITTSQCRQDLMEFFDDKKNWGESAVRSGRSWKVDELRIKSNSDLHKLWFVLLKERNMLLTMEADCKRRVELFPGPERIDKVKK